MDYKSLILTYSGAGDHPYGIIFFSFENCANYCYQK